MTDPNRDPNRDPIPGDDPERSDDALERAEGELTPLLGRPRGDVEGEASSDFREALRAAFVSGRFEGDEAVEPELAAALDAWEVPPARPEARERARAEFVGSSTSERTPEHTTENIGAPVRSHRRPAARTSRARDASRPSLRLLVGGGLLAAAAALLLVLRGLGGDTPDIPSPVTPDDTQVASADSRWSLDRERDGALMPDGWWRDVHVDDATFASLDELERALDGANVVRVGEAPVRMKFADEYVLELAQGAEIRIGAANAGAGQGAPRTLYASRGALRVATGPGFDGNEPLVIETPHVRTEVVGTILGIDVAGEYTCVCCLEGKVRTMPCPRGPVDFEATDVGEQRTLVAHVELGKQASYLVPHHRVPLTDLVEYWS